MTCKGCRGPVPRSVRQQGPDAVSRWLHQRRWAYKLPAPLPLLGPDGRPPRIKPRRRHRRPRELRVASSKNRE